MKPYFVSSDKRSVLYNADCNDVLTTLPDNTIQTIFADPPYFLSKGGFYTPEGKWICRDKADWDKSISPEEMDEFNMKWLSSCRNKLKEDGTIWVSGTFHNIFSVVNCLRKLNYKILNIITWQKTDPRPTLGSGRFVFSTELIIWARKNMNIRHKFNEDVMLKLNSGNIVTDVWKLPAVAMWEKTHGHHPTQKPLSLLYRVLLAATDEDDIVLDPFNGSGTTGVASKLLGRKYIGIDKCTEYLDLTTKRILALYDEKEYNNILSQIQLGTEEPTVLINNVTPENHKLMVERGICYLRAGDAKGSLLVTRGFERLEYVFIHSKANEGILFKLTKKGFQIWTQEQLNSMGFKASHASYYAVLHFDNLHPIERSRKNIEIKGYNGSILPIGMFI